MWFLFYVVLPVVVIVLGYILVLRPILHALPALKGFYAEADTFWQKAKALAWNSLTIAWSYVIAVIGVIMQQFDSIAAALGDPDLKANLSTAIGADTKTLGYVLLGISLMTLLTRLRSLKG